MTLQLDGQGRPVINVEITTFSLSSNFTVNAGTTITFGDVGSNIRFKNGKLQIQDATTLYWHWVLADSASGLPTIFLSVDYEIV